MARFLIIEDEEESCRTLCKLYERHKHEAECAHSMTEALACLESAHYDCIILDPGQPDCDSIDSIRKIDTEFKGVPTVVYTASHDYELASEAKNRTAHFVIKGNGNSWHEVYRASIQAITHKNKAPHLIRELIESQMETPMKPWYERWFPVMLGAGGIVASIWGFGSLIFNVAHVSLEDHNVIITHSETLKNHSIGIMELDRKADRSIDDRMGIHKDIGTLMENQKGLRDEILRRLDKIDDKLDRTPKP